jgi:hypothetical protein
VEQQVPYIGDGALYRCALCGAQIPDGASVDASWNEDGSLSTVIVTLANAEDSTVVHSCG